VFEFQKFQALGNDFVVLDLRSADADISPAESTAWCDRHFGVGADGVLTILKGGNRSFAEMVVHNADGSIAQMCGNGLRCVVKYLAEREAPGVHMITIQTGAGQLDCEPHWNTLNQVDEVTVHMGPAKLKSEILPKQGVLNELFEGFRATAVSMGNPHLVLIDQPLEQAAILGPRFEHHQAFSNRTNVECAILRNGILEVSVWERGVGLTLACGTGACAAVVAYALNKELPFDSWVDVRLPGGPLKIKVLHDLSNVMMRGGVTHVFSGQRQ
jgi:diaminopimelate epimerase